MGALEDLQAAFEQHIAVTNARDLDALLATYHDQAVVFARCPPPGSSAKRLGWFQFQRLLSVPGAGGAKNLPIIMRIPTCHG